MKQNWFYFVRLRLTSTKQSRKKIKQVLNFFSTFYVLLRQSKTLTKNYEKKWYSVGFLKSALKFFTPN